jgi:alkylation response protein AidB-like acyl-CoA dehydrogenase
MDDDERALLAATVRRAAASSHGTALDGVLIGLGWPEALSVEPRLAVSSLFESMGQANTTSSALDAVAGSALGVKTGPSVGTVLPALGRWRPPGRIAGNRMFVRGVGTASLGDTTTAWVVAGADDRMVVVEVATAELELRPVHGVDPDLGLVEVAGGEAPLAAPHRLDPGDWTRAVTRARLAVGHELVGASRAMVALARSHALERVQFGRPIADFQAVRHRLAETLVAIEATDAALGAAWDEGSPAAAATAKALAGRSARTASLHCQQVLAGIGFTTEHDFHRYARRVLVLDQLFGTARALTRDLGRTLLTDRRLPPLPPL